MQDLLIFYEGHIMHALCILSTGPAGLKDGHAGIIDHVEGSTMC